MESYLDVKREGRCTVMCPSYFPSLIYFFVETIRRMFYNWLNKARSARQLRNTLQEREDEIRIAKISVAWEKWRDRFKDEKLRPIVGHLGHSSAPRNDNIPSTGT
jgi:hypothetical protein